MNFLIQIIIGVVLSVASTLIQAALNHNKNKQPGVRGEIQTGGDNPLAFIMGKFATAGQFEYAGTWGNSGDTPNAYFTKVVSVSDLPVRGLSGFYVDGARVTLADTADATLGFPVLEYRKDGKDYLWVKFYDGTQTHADSLLLSAFGSDPERPWESNMVFRGVAYFIATALVNREFFPSFPEYLAEIDGIPLYDDRHENPVAAIHDVLRSFSYDGTWIYGPHGVGENHLIGLDAQADKCDALVDLAGGGTEPRFRFGYEVTVDTEPHVVIGELLKACQGRIAEIGGRYKVLVAEPAEAVKAFTDEDIVVTDGQKLDPFPGLESTYNAITATYPEPAESWGDKEAPPRYYSELEALDAGHRRPFSEQYKAVPFALQVQRNMRATIEESRRFRRHSFTAPPEWWELEVLDTVQWSSAYNGYDDKVFLITVMGDQPNGNQIVGLQEQDPADYDWSSDYELDYDLTPVVIVRPEPQVMQGWQAEAVAMLDNHDLPRRPSIKVYFAGGLDDVRAVRVQVFLGDTDTIIFDGETPYDPAVASPSVVLNGTFVPATDYEVRGKLVPFSGRATSWSDRIAVTTLDLGFGEADLPARVRAWLQQLDTTRQAALAPIQAQIEERLSQLGQDVAGVLAMLNERIDGPNASSVVNYIGLANAAITEVRTVAEGLADLFVNVFAGNDIRSANGLFRITANEGPGGAGVSISLEARAMVADLFKAAGISIYAFADEDGGESGVEIHGDKVTIITPTGERLNALLFTAQDTPRDTPITVEDDVDVIRIDLSGRQSRHKVTLTSDAEMRAPVSATSMDYSVEVHQDGAGSRALAFSDEFIPPKPALSGSALLPGAINIIDHKILSLNPMRIAASLFGTFADTPILTYRDHLGGGGATASTTQVPFVFKPALFGPRLDFQAGNLLVVFGYGQAINLNNNFGNSANVTDNAVSNWQPIVSVDGNIGVSSRHRVRGLWKIADGSEGSIQPFVFSSTSSHHYTAVYSIIAFDFLGGTMTLDTNVNASVDAAATQTIKTGDHAAPALALSFAGNISDTGATPSVDQSFSVTPDGNFTDAPLDGNPGGRWRLKYRLFDSSPTDVTTALDNAAVASCAFYLK